jgi:hypothetical protein
MLMLLALFHADYVKRDIFVILMVKLSRHFAPLAATAPAAGCLHLLHVLPAAFVLQAACLLQPRALLATIVPPAT